MNALTDFFRGIPAFSQRHVYAQRHHALTEAITAIQKRLADLPADSPLKAGLWEAVTVVTLVQAKQYVLEIGALDSTEEGK